MPETSKLIEVVEFDTGDVVKTLGPMSERKAEKCDSGMQHNLNHERFYTRIVDAPQVIRGEVVT